MSIQINKSAYEKLIKEDIEWLLSNTKDSLERRHIVEVLNYSPERLYASGSSEIPKDLEEAAEEYKQGEIDTNVDYHDETGEPLCFMEALKPAFIKGAEWQKEKDDTLIKKAHDFGFGAGTVWQKVQMLKEAVEGHILGEIRNQEEKPYEIYAESDFLPLNGKFKMGDEVKLIIIKGN